MTSAAFGDGWLAIRKPPTLTAAVNRRLTSIEGQRLIPLELVEMWTEHSERATLPTILDGFGLDPRDRDALGRWRPEGSDIYSRSFSGKIRRIHRYFTAEIEKLRLSGDVDDDDVLEAAFAWLRSRRGFQQEGSREGRGDLPSEVHWLPGAQRIRSSKSRRTKVKPRGITQTLLPRLPRKSLWRGHQGMSWYPQGAAQSGCIDRARRAAGWLGYDTLMSARW